MLWSPVHKNLDNFNWLEDLCALFPPHSLLLGVVLGLRRPQFSPGFCCSAPVWPCIFSTHIICYNPEKFTLLFIQHKPSIPAWSKLTTALRRKKHSKALTDTSRCSPAHFAFLLLSLPLGTFSTLFHSLDVSAASKWQFLPLLNCCQYPGTHSPSKKGRVAA